MPQTMPILISLEQQCMASAPIEWIVLVKYEMAKYFVKYVLSLFTDIFQKGFFKKRNQEIHNNKMNESIKLITKKLTI